MDLLIALGLACAPDQSAEEESGISATPMKTDPKLIGDTILDGQVSTMTAADDDRLFVVTNTGADATASASVLETDGSVSASAEIPSGYYRSGATLNNGQIALPYSIPTSNQYGVRLFDPNTGKITTDRDFSNEEGVTGIDAVVPYGENGFAFVYNNADYTSVPVSFNGSGLMVVDDADDSVARDIPIDSNNATSVSIIGDQGLVGTSGEYKNDGAGNPVPDKSKNGGMVAVDLGSSKTTFETSLPAGAALNGQVDKDALGRVFYVGSDDQNHGAGYLSDGKNVTHLNFENADGTTFIAGGQILYASEDGNDMQFLVLENAGNTVNLVLERGNPSTNTWTHTQLASKNDAAFAGGLVQVNDTTYAYSYAKPDGTSEVVTYQFSR